MKRIVVVTALYSLLIAGCKQGRNDLQSSPGTPESLQEKTSTEMSFSKSRNGNLVESLYAELLEKNPELNELEKTIANLDDQKDDSLKTFKIFDQKTQLTTIQQNIILATYETRYYG